MTSAVASPNEPSRVVSVGRLDDGPAGRAERREVSGLVLVAFAANQVGLRVVDARPRTRRGASSSATRCSHSRKLFRSDGESLKPRVKSPRKRPRQAGDRTPPIGADDLRRWTEPDAERNSRALPRGPSGNGSAAPMSRTREQQRGDVRRRRRSGVTVARSAPSRAQAEPCYELERPSERGRSSWISSSSRSTASALEFDNCIITQTTRRSRRGVVRDRRVRRAHWRKGVSPAANLSSSRSPRESRERPHRLGAGRRLSAKPAVILERAGSLARTPVAGTSRAARRSFNEPFPCTSCACGSRRPANRRTR